MESAEFHETYDFPYISHIFPLLHLHFLLKNSPEAIDTVGLCKRACLTFGHVAGHDAVVHNLQEIETLESWKVPSGYD